MLILASASAIRSTMLRNAGIDHRVVPSRVDERQIMARLDDAAAIAAELASAKAVETSARHPDDWVIGGDSVVSVGDRIFAKPRDRGEAAAHLRLFSGRSMILTSSVALARSGAVDWVATDSASLEVRALSDEFIDDYLELEWPEVGHCVGVFRMEGRGVQLFERIEGNHFTILGMPLLPLLGALRQRAVIAG